MLLPKNEKSVLGFASIWINREISVFISHFMFQMRNCFGVLALVWSFYYFTGKVHGVLTENAIRNILFIKPTLGIRLRICHHKVKVYVHHLLICLEGTENRKWKKWINYTDEPTMAVSNPRNCLFWQYLFSNKKWLMEKIVSTKIITKNEETKPG